MIFRPSDQFQCGIPIKHDAVGRPSVAALRDKPLKAFRFGPAP
jgi:hypothetical protein